MLEIIELRDHKKGKSWDNHSTVLDGIDTDDGDDDGRIADKRDNQDGGEGHQSSRTVKHPTLQRLDRVYERLFNNKTSTINDYDVDNDDNIYADNGVSHSIDDGLSRSRSSRLKGPIEHIITASIKIESFAISVIDAEPAEVAYLCLNDIEWSIQRSRTQISTVRDVWWVS